MDDHENPSGISRDGKAFVCIVGTPIAFLFIGALLKRIAPEGWIGDMDVCCWGTFLGYISGCGGAVAWIAADKEAADRAEWPPLEEDHRTRMPGWLWAIAGIVGTFLIFSGMMGAYWLVDGYLKAKF